MSCAYWEWLRFAYAADLDAEWCVVIARKGREQRAQAELALAGWSTYLPMEQVWLGKGDRRRQVRQPLFSRYFFAHVNEGGVSDGHRQIDDIVDVRRIEGRSAVRPQLLGRLMLLEAADGLKTCPARKRKAAFVAGQPVVVRAGVLKGFDAMILKVLSEREVIASFPLPYSRGEGEATFQVENLQAA